MPTAPCRPLPSAAHLPRANGLLVNSACTHGERMGTRASNCKRSRVCLDAGMQLVDTRHQSRCQQQLRRLPGSLHSVHSCGACIGAALMPPPVPQSSPPAVEAGNGASAAPASVTAPSCCSARPRLGCCCGCCECAAAATARSAASSAASSAGRACRCALLHPMGVLQVGGRSMHVVRGSGEEEGSRGKPCCRGCALSPPAEHGSVLGAGTSFLLPSKLPIRSWLANPGRTATRVAHLRAGDRGLLPLLVHKLG